jgi:hypothetical protein
MFDDDEDTDEPALSLADLGPPEPKRLDYDLAELVANPGFAPKDHQSEAPLEAWETRKSEVIPSPDLDRILALPRREPVEPGSVRSLALVDHISRRHRKPDGPCDCASRIPPLRPGQEKPWIGWPCILTLREIQAWTLHEIRLYGGINGSIGVGHGKTMLDLLAAMAMPECRTAVLLVPANLIKQLIAEYEYLRNHWRLPSMTVHGRDETDRQFTSDEPNAPRLHVLSYQRLSRAECTAWLHDVAPDLIIADESDKLSDLNTATVSRFMRYLEDHPKTRFLWWTGSPTDRSILEYQHLSRAALGEGSPVPNDIDTAHDWARAIDPSDSPAPMGALKALCRPGEHIYDGFHRRLTETPGFIHTTTSSSDVPIRILERDPGEVPDEIADALSTLRNDWVRPDGWTYETALETAACARQLACGFYYYWHYPRGEKQSLIDEWLDVRKSWCGELRSMLKTSRREHLDSELLLKRAAARFHGDLPPDDTLPSWESLFWPAWRDIADKVQPETRPILLDPFLAEDAARWGDENTGVIWYESSAFGRWIAEISGLELHAGGPEGEKRIAALVKKGSNRSIVASMKSHGRGRNGLQYLYSTQVVAQPPSSPKMWEQLLGRLSRPGQTAPEVEAHLYRHTDELDSYVENALIRARYVRGTMGAAQKILDGGLRSRRKPPKAE